MAGRGQNGSARPRCRRIEAYLVAGGREVIGDMLVHLVYVLLLVLLRVGRHDVEAEMLELMPPPREGHHVAHTTYLRQVGCANVVGMTSLSTVEPPC